MKQLLERMQAAKDRISEGVAFIGFVTAIIALFLPDDISTSIKYAMIIILLVGYALYFAFTRINHIVAPEKKRIFTIDVPCDPAAVDDAIELAKYFFGRSTIRPDVVRAATRKNPISLIVAKDASGQVIGYVDGYGLEAPTFDKLIAGHLKEDGFKNSDFCDISQIVQQKRIYIGGIAVKSKSKFESGLIVKGLLNALCDVIARNYIVKESDFEIYATSYTSEGRDMLRSIGFGKCSEGVSRDDKTDLYTRSVNRKAILSYKRQSGIDKDQFVFHVRKPS